MPKIIFFQGRVSRPRLTVSGSDSKLLLAITLTQAWRCNLWVVGRNRCEGMQFEPFLFVNSHLGRIGYSHFGKLSWLQPTFSRRRSKDPNRRASSLTTAQPNPSNISARRAWRFCPMGTTSLRTTFLARAAPAIELRCSVRVTAARLGKSRPSCKDNGGQLCSSTRVPCISWALATKTASWSSASPAMEAKPGPRRVISVPGCSWPTADTTAPQCPCWSTPVGFGGAWRIPSDRRGKVVASAPSACPHQ
jgi:hypothetical protein